MDNIKDIIIKNKVYIYLLLLTIAFVIIISFINRETTFEYNPDYEVNSSVVNKNYKVNEYHLINIELIDLLNDYLHEYLKLENTDIDKAWNMLSDETKDSFNNEIDKYKEYVEKIKTINTVNATVDKYKNNLNEYDIIDSEGRKYTIVEKATWDIKITLN